MSTAALALLVQVVSIHGKSELMMRQMAGAYPRRYALELEPEAGFDEEDDDLFGPAPALPAEGEAVAEAPLDPTAAQVFAASAGAAQPAPVDPEVTYATLHPVYTRCKAKVDLLGFSLAIQKTCGDIHELADVAWPCRSAMQDYSKKVG